MGKRQSNNKGDWNYISKSFGKVVGAKRPNTKWSLKPPKDPTPKHCVPKWDGEAINVYRDKEGKLTYYNPIQVYNYKSAYARYNRGRTIRPEYNDIQTINSVLYNVYHYPSCDAPSGYWSVYYPANTTGYQSAVKITRPIEPPDDPIDPTDTDTIIDIWDEYTDGSVEWNCNGENQIITWENKIPRLVHYTGQLVCDYDGCNLNGTYSHYSIRITIGNNVYNFSGLVQLEYQEPVSGGSCGIEGYPNCNDNQSYCDGSNGAIVTYNGATYEVSQDNLPVSVDTYQLLSYTDNDITNTIRSDNWGMTYEFRSEIDNTAMGQESNGCNGSCPNVENYNAKIYLKPQTSSNYELAYTDTTYPTNIVCNDITECTISWDNQSVQLQDPNSNYNIITLPDVPYKITWDGGGSGKEHIINNPNNYSYQVIQDIKCKDYGVEFRATYLECTTRGEIARDSGWLNFGNHRFPHNIRLKNLPNQGTCPFGTSNAIYYIIAPIFDRAITTNCSQIQTYDANYWIGTGANINLQTRLTPLDGIDAYKIRISDNNINYEYPIINTNSVQIIYNQGGKKIQIEGNQYDIIDENSVSKLCITTYTVTADGNTIYSNITPVDVRLLCNKEPTMTWYLDVSDSAGSISSVEVSSNNIPVSVQGYIDITDNSGTTTNTSSSKDYSISCISNGQYCLTMTEVFGDREETVCHTSDMRPIVRIDYLPYTALIGEDVITGQDVILAECDDPIITNPTYNINSNSYTVTNDGSGNNIELPIGANITTLDNNQWIITIYDSNGNVINEYIVNQRPSIRDDGTITPIEIEITNPELLRCTCPDYTRTTETTIKDGILDVKGNNWQDSQAGSPILLGQRYCKHVSSLLNILGKQKVYENLLKDYPIELSTIFETENKNSKRTGWIGEQDESNTFNFEKGLSPTINKGNLPKFEDYK